MGEEFDFDSQLLKYDPFFDLLKAGDELGFDIEDNINTNFAEVATTIIDNYIRMRKGYIIRDYKLFRQGVHTLKGFFG